MCCTYCKWCSKTSDNFKNSEVTDLYSALQMITKHFKLSIENKELLNERLSMLELKPIHMILQCQTMMGYFFKACTACNDILQVLYDVKITANISVENRDIFFTAKNKYTLKVISNTVPYFSEKLLHPSGKSNLLVSTVYKQASFVAKKFGDNFVTKSATKFLEVAA